MSLRWGRCRARACPVRHGDHDRLLAVAGAVLLEVERFHATGASLPLLSARAFEASDEQRHAVRPVPTVSAFAEPVLTSRA
jgi:hypothetical protein